MPPEDQDPNADGGDPVDAAIEAAAGATPTSTALPPADVRNSPEFKALERENRKLARTNGQLTGQASAARTAAEEARIAAEATAQAALEAQITETLGEEGVAFWAEFSELSATDPVAAAKRLAEVLSSKAVAQSAAGDGAAAAADANAGEGTTVPATTPPPPTNGVDGGASLGQPAEATPAEVAATLEKTYQDTVARVQDPLQRNRVTQRDRAAGFIAYLGAAVVKATGNRPRV